MVSCNDWIDRDWDLFDDSKIQFRISKKKYFESIYYIYSETEYIIILNRYQRLETLIT